MMSDNVPDAFSRAITAEKKVAAFRMLGARQVKELSARTSQFAETDNGTRYTVTVHREASTNAVELHG